MDIVLIPAYKPDDELIRLLDQLAEIRPAMEVVVVDDGSGPGFDEVFSKAEKNATVLHHEVNRGKGAALRTGMSFIKDSRPGCGVVVMADADGQHPAADIAAIREKCAEENEFVLTTRIFRNMPVRSRIGNSLIRWFYTFINHDFLTDNQCGLRAFPARLLDLLLEVPGNRYDYEISMLCYMEKTGVKIVPFYREAVYIGNNESSHYRAFADTVLVAGKMASKVWPSAVGMVLRILAAVLASVYLGGSVNPLLDVLGGGLISTAVVILLYMFAAFPGGRYRDAKREAVSRIITDIAATAVTAFFQYVCRIPHVAAFFIALVLVYAAAYNVMKIRKKVPH